MSLALYTVPFPSETEKAGGLKGGRPAGISPVRVKSCMPLIDNRYAATIAKINTIALFATNKQLEIAVYLAKIFLNFTT